MNCSEPRCTQPCISTPIEGPSKWHHYEDTIKYERKTPKEGKSYKIPLLSMNGVPLHPSKRHSLCYYHWKKENRYYGHQNKRTKIWIESPYIGKESNPTVVGRNGKTRVLGPGWGDSVSVPTGRRPLQPHPIHMGRKSIQGAE